MYAYQTFGQMKQKLSAVLYQNATDATQQFWQDAELGTWIVEALQTFNAFTSFWRTELPYNPNTANSWTDITATANSPRAMTTTDNAILQAIELCLLEPTTSVYPLTWNGSSQFQVTDLLDAIQRTRDEIFGVTGCTLFRRVIGAPIQDVVPMGQNTIDVRRVAWFPSANNFNNTTLFKSSDFELQSYNPLYTTGNGPPSTWRQSAQPPLSFYVNNPPPIPGNYECMTTEGNGDLNTNNSTIVAIPNDWAWLIKWGALDDLLTRESLAQDMLRAQYAYKRYEEGMGLLSQAAAVLAARINNIPTAVDSVYNADCFNPLWQVGTGNVTSIYTAGLNFVAHAQIPANATAFSITLQVVQNAPIPANNGDLVQLEKDDLQVVLDYAHHLAAFKQGGQEFLNTIPLYQGFMKRCAEYNSKLKELGTYSMTQLELSQLEEERNPRYSKGDTPAAA